jgi:hypothetical protein
MLNEKKCLKVAQSPVEYVEQCLVGLLLYQRARGGNVRRTYKNTFVNDCCVSPKHWT